MQLIVQRSGSACLISFRAADKWISPLGFAADGIGCSALMKAWSGIFEKLHNFQQAPDLPARPVSVMLMLDYPWWCGKYNILNARADITAIDYGSLDLLILPHASRKVASSRTSSSARR
jgi:hypothetical protein